MNHRRVNVLGVSSLALLGALLAPWHARAQDAVCAPACLTGEICVAGTCMTPACRPPCGPGESCVAGTCMVPARRPVAPPAPLAPLSTQPRAVVEEVAPTPIVTRRGSLVIPQVGVNSFQEDAAQTLSPGLRLAGMLGGYVTNDVSLGGTLTFDWMNWDPPAGYSTSSFILEAAFSPLFHVGDSRAEFVVGPAVGGWMRSFNSSNGVTGRTSSSTARGWSLGGNVGLFVPVSTIRLGVMLNFMLRDPSTACETIDTVETCAGDGPRHQVMGFAVAAKL